MDGNTERRTRWHSDSADQYWFFVINEYNVLSAIYQSQTITIEIPSSVEESGASSLNLNTPYPNPFNPDTAIPFDLPEDGVVKLDIYSATGQQVATLVDQPMSSGNHTVRWNASGMSAGVYFARLRYDGQVRTTKMVLLK